MRVAQIVQGLRHSILPVPVRTPAVAPEVDNITNAATCGLPPVVFLLDVVSLSYELIESAE